MASSLIVILGELNNFWFNFLITSYQNKPDHQILEYELREVGSQFDTHLRLLGNNHINIEEIYLNKAMLLSVYHNNNLNSNKNN